MSLNPKTPGVYIQEISVFPPSVAEVESAVPAFVGYTEKAQRVLANDLVNKPTEVRSLTEYEQLFGGPDMQTHAVGATLDGAGAVTAVSYTPPTPRYLLHHAMNMFFANGGGRCYVVSVGSYKAASASPAVVDTELAAGLAKVGEEDEPTLIVIPEAVKLGDTNYQTLMQAALKQCGDLGDRFAIIDVLDGANATVNLATARGHWGNNHLKYGAAYFPFLRSSIVHPLAANASSGVLGSNVNVTVTTAAAPAPPASPAPPAPPAPPSPAAAVPTLDAVTNTAVVAAVRAELAKHTLVLPPGAAVAGIYAMVDTSRGVWKAPANVSLAQVIEPVVKLDDARQENFNVDASTGKSINALRAFAGKGTLVWGARTLAGNDNEWRYVPVRRFFNMVEESVKKSTHWAVFEPNDANTWVKVRGMIENYLTQKWREGALAGATPRDAFFVRCGLGQTMNAQDILEGRMNVEIGMAVVRPAEFIILKFSHKLQTS